LPELVFWTTFVIFTGLCALCLLTAGRHSDGTLDVMAPAAPFSLVIFIHFGLGSVYGWTGLDPKLDHPNPLPALLLTTVGLATFIIGYNLPVVRRAKSIAHRLPDWRPRRAIRAACILVVVGFGVTVLGFSGNAAFFVQTKEATEATDADSQVAFLGGLLNVGLSLLAAIAASTMRRERARIVLLLIAVVPLMFVLTGRRIFIFVALATIGFAWHYYISRIRLSLLFGLGIFTIIVVTPFGQLWRTAYQSMNVTRIADIPAVADSFASELGSMSLQDYLTYAIGEDQRLNEAATLGALQAAVPSTADYKYGQTYLPIVTWLVPRFLWHDKPDFQFYNEIGHTTGLVGPRDKVTTIIYTSVGELYLNFGEVGVAIGMLVIGMLARWLYQALIAGARNGLAVFAYGLLVLSLWTEEALGPSVGGAMRDVAAGVLVLLVCRGLVPRGGVGLLGRRRSVTVSA